MCVKFKGQIQVPALPCLPTCLRWTVIDLPQTPGSCPMNFSWSPVCASYLPVVLGLQTWMLYLALMWTLGIWTRVLILLATSPALDYFPLLSVCVSARMMYVCGQECQSTCRHQRTSLWSWFSHSTFRWVLGIKLRLPDCVANSFTRRVILLALD